MSKPDLSQLPRHIIKYSRKWYKNTLTGKYIPASRIAEHLPKNPAPQDQILQKRWDLNY